MKYEPRFPLRALDNVLIIEDNKLNIYNMYQITQDPIYFFDYVNYYIPAGGTQTITLNGQSIPVGSYNLHVANLSTPSRNVLNQVYLGIDSMDIAVKVMVNGTYMFYLTPTGTYLTGEDSPITRDMDHFVWAAGSSILPQLEIKNLNPSFPVAALGQNQGIQVWGYTYNLKLLSPQEAELAFKTNKYTTITPVPVPPKGGQ